MVWLIYTPVRALWQPCSSLLIQPCGTQHTAPQQFGCAVTYPLYRYQYIYRCHIKMKKRKRKKPNRNKLCKLIKSRELLWQMLKLERSLRWPIYFVTTQLIQNWSVILQCISAMTIIKSDNDHLSFRNAFQFLPYYLLEAFLVSRWKIKTALQTPHHTLKKCALVCSRMCFHKNMKVYSGLSAIQSSQSIQRLFGDITGYIVLFKNIRGYSLV